MEKPSWDTKVNAPLLTTKLGIANILTDSSAKENPDSSIRIVENQVLYNYSLDSLVSIDVEPYTKTVKLATLKLDSQVVTRNISLGEIARQLLADSDPSNKFLGAFIIGSNGSTADIPDFGPLAAGPFPIDISSYFETADLVTGTMTVKITNNLPLEIQTVDYNIKNHSSGVTIISNTVSNLTPGTTSIDSLDMAGKTVEGKLDTRMTGMYVKGGNNVPIDTSKSIQVKISITHITVSAATAVFPTQTVIDDHAGVPLLNMGDVELLSAKIKQGRILIDMYSTVKDTLHFTYAIPSATKNGIPFDTSSFIQPASGGTAAHRTFDIDFSNYVLDLTRSTADLSVPDTVNTIYNTLKAGINYSGIKESLSLQDSVYVLVTFDGVLPSYIKGFLGRDTLNIGPSSVNFDIFKKIESGTLNFEQVKIALVIDNGIGLSADVNIKNITATNSRTGSSIPLVSPVINTNQSVAKAVDNPSAQTSIPVSDTINLSAGSNALALINSLPDQISYQAEVYLNPGGKPASQSLYSDFAYSKTSLVPSLQIELPLSMIASGLTLADTVDFSGKDIQSKVKNGDFTVHVENGFPLQASLSMYFLSPGGSVLDSMVSTGIVAPAPISGSRATGKASSSVPFHLDATRVSNIALANRIIFKVKFSTVSAPPGNFIKIYSDYEMDFKLTGGFDYQVR
ncbi:MAG: hypothetical protein ACJ75J_16350 [Cytophagaceae bacterium]